MRFAGQEHTLTVVSPMRRDAVDDDPDEVAEIFLREYERTFGSTIDEALEIVCVRAIVTAGHDGARTIDPAREGARPVRTAGLPPTAIRCRRRGRSPAAGNFRSRVLDRAALAPGKAPEGPAIILEETATTYLDAGYVLRVDRGGALILTSEESQTINVIPARGAGRAIASVDESGDHRDHPPRAQRRRRSDETCARPHVVLASDLRGTGLRGGAV